TNDLNDLQVERRDDLLMQYLRKEFTQNLPARQREIDRIVAQYLVKEEEDARGIANAKPSTTTERALQFLAATGLRTFFQKSWERRATTQTVISDEDFVLFEEVLTEANKMVKSWGGRLHFVYLPSAQRFKKGLFTKSPYPDMHDHVL